MGDRYILSVGCPDCGFEDHDVWFAPTCDVTEWHCPHCGHTVDLVELTGITAEIASNATKIEQVIRAMDDETAMGLEHKLCVKCPFCSGVNEYEWDTSKVLQNEIEFLCKYCPAILWVNLMLSGTQSKRGKEMF